MPAAPMHAALADEVSDAQATLAQAEERMQQISEEYAELQSQVDDLQVQIDDATDGVMDAQAAAQEGRANLGDMLSYEYRTGGLNLLTVVFGSESLSDLLNNLRYLEAVQKNQAAAIEEQKRLEQEFADALSSLNEKKDDQMEALSAAEEKSEEAAQLVEGAQARLSEAEDAAAEEAARLAELARQAEELKTQQAAEAQAQAVPGAAAADGAASDVEQESAGQGGGSNAGAPADTGAGTNAGTGAEAGSDAAGGGSNTTTPDSSMGWQTGVASAYGAESDGTLGKPTATGAIVTETSMGVAIPMSWPNYRSYFGRAVEITYAGRTVIATVNDCGGMGGGSRSLDLQPGVWKALGASSCDDWGLRTVSYRFL